MVIEATAAFAGYSQMDNAQLGHFVARERKAMGLTQTELAQKMGMSQSFVAALEQGQKSRTTKQTLRKLANALRVRYVDLLIAAGEIEAEDVGLDPAMPDDLRVVQALWSDLDDSSRANIVTLARGAAERNRAPAD